MDGDDDDDDDDDDYGDDDDDDDDAFMFCFSYDSYDLLPPSSSPSPS